MKEVRANGFGGRVAAEPNGPIRGLRKEYTIINEESDGYTLFNTTDERGASKRRGIVAALAAVAMLVPLAFAPSATAAEGDYSGGIKGEYNALGIAAGVATEAYSGLNSQERQDTVLANFNQITPENSMKPEGWYDGNHEFAMSDNTRSLLKFASDNNIRIYGHVLVWHSQTPDWFFQADEWCEDTNNTAGVTSCPLADKATMQERQRQHIENVAKAISDEFGPFGSDTNPVVAFDVVNETVNDTDNPDTNGMRNSLWYQTYDGEDYIYDAFENANTYFNEVYADPSDDHPVTLFINDYNTEQSGKRTRYAALLDRMVAEGVPFDGIGHQFHVTLTTATSNLEAALTDMERFNKKQAITELDVTTGTPVTEAKLIEQGQYYYEVNQIIHRHAAQLFSVTVWGLIDGLSWRSGEGAPLLFDDNLEKKPAYIGYIGDSANLPEPLKSMNAFKDDAVGIDSALPGTVAESGASSPWERLSLVEMTPSANGAVSGSFNVYWKDGSLVVYADVADVSAADDDTVTVRVGDSEYTIGRNGVTGGEGVQANVVSSDAGYEVVADIPYTGAEKDIVEMNVIATDSATTETSAWSTNDTGAVTLAEPLSYTEAVKVPADAQAPVVDADPSDPVWAEANEVPVDKVTAATPSPEATATAKTLWSDGKLYVLMEVTDADIDLTNSNPWEKDSVEVYIDRGNTKSGQYTNDIQQIRVSADGAELSFGSGASEDVQKSMVQTAGTIVDGGYVVEMAIDLGTAEAGTFEGVDFQINDAKNGARIGIRNWADPTGAGYQTASHWGVLRLLADSSETETPGGEETPGGGTDKPGDEKPQPSDDADNDDKMPQTGSAVIGVAVVALLLVAAGCGLVIARRR